MSTELDRGLLTDALLEALKATNRPVGDGEAPVNPKGGWIGEPNAPGSKFVAYTVLTAMAAARSQGTFNAPQDYWQLPYSLLSCGGARRQADWMAQQGLDALSALAEQVVDCGGPWKILEVWVGALGATPRSDATDPPYWQRLDSIIITVTKEN